MSNPQPKNPLHGVTLEMIINRLVELYGWEELGRQFDVKCFQLDPSVKSSLSFFRKNEWARKELEAFYLKALSTGSASS
jgi:uncharacterized protein (DUF2132 family)